MNHHVQNPTGQWRRRRAERGGQARRHHRGPAARVSGSPAGESSGGFVGRDSGSPHRPPQSRRELSPTSWLRLAAGGRWPERSFPEGSQADGTSSVPRSAPRTRPCRAGRQPRGPYSALQGPGQHRPGPAERVGHSKGLLAFRFEKKMLQDPFFFGWMGDAPCE